MTTVATANLGNRPDAAVLDGLEHLASEGVSVIGLQEAGDRAKMLGRFCDRYDWRCWIGDEEGSPSTPILWNPRAVLVSHQGTRPATPATYTGRLGAGPNKVKAKVWNHVRVLPRHEEERVPFVFINGHLPASLWAPRRRALANRQVDVLADMFRRRRGRIDVVAVMDGNAKPNDRLWNPIRERAEQYTDRPTHGRRTIDLVWSTVHGKARVIDAPSDHRWVTFTI